jgi:hypothetical protein
MQTKNRVQRSQIFYPSQINLYLECPERYYRKYVERRKVVEPFSRPLAKGIAAHSILSEAFAEFRQQKSLPTDIQGLAERALRADSYPADVRPFWMEDVATVVRDVKWTLKQFSGKEEVLATEETLSYNYPGSHTCPPFVLRAKVDLVVLQPDGTLEHIDFKTGGRKPNKIQDVISRIVVGNSYDAGSTPIRTTTYFAGDQTSMTAILAQDECQETWQRIRNTITAIGNSDTWPAVPTPLCAWCPYFEIGCSLNVPTLDQLEMTSWLEG